MRPLSVPLPLSARFGRLADPFSYRQAPEDPASPLVSVGFSELANPEHRVQLSGAWQDEQKDRFAVTVSPRHPLSGPPFRLELPAREDLAPRQLSARVSFPAEWRWKQGNPTVAADDPQPRPYRDATDAVVYKHIPLPALIADAYALLAHHRQAQPAKAPETGHGTETAQAHLQRAIRP